MSVDITDKVRKLLRLAEGAGSPDEANAALAQAHRIAALHQIDLATVDAEGVKPPINADTPEPFGPRKKRFPLWMQELLDGLAELCGCYAFMQKGWDIGAETYYWTHVMVGTERDRGIVRTLAPALLATVEAQTRIAAKKRTGLQRNRFREGFVRSYLWRMRAEQNDVLAEVRKSSQGKLVPVASSVQRHTEARDRTRELYDIASTSAPAERNSDALSKALGWRAADSVSLPGEHAALTGQLALGGES